MWMISINLSLNLYLSNFRCSNLAYRFAVNQLTYVHDYANYILYKQLLGGFEDFQVSSYYY